MTRNSKLQPPSQNICTFPSAGVGSAEWAEEREVLHSMKGGWWRSSDVYHMEIFGFATWSKLSSDAIRIGDVGFMKYKPGGWSWGDWVWSTIICGLKSDPEPGMRDLWLTFLPRLTSVFLRRNLRPLWLIMLCWIGLQLGSTGSWSFVLGVLWVYVSIIKDYDVIVLGIGFGPCLGLCRKGQSSINREIVVISGISMLTCSNSFLQLCSIETTDR